MAFFSQIGMVATADQGAFSEHYSHASSDRDLVFMDRAST